MATRPVENDEFDDPIEYFIDEQRYHGKSNRTLDAYERVLSDFSTFVTGGRGSGDLEDIQRRQCMEWVHSLRSECAPSTVASYASYINRFYRYMVEIGVYERNPMQLVVDQMEESIEQDPMRRDLSVYDMRSFLRSITHPLTNIMVVTLLKTGVRVGELVNIDLKDIHLTANVPSVSNTRPELRDHPKSLYIDDTITRGEPTNGEVRTATNKRQRPTIIPLDDELSRSIRRWLLYRPDSQSVAQPLFVDTGDRWGCRVTPENVRYRVRKAAEQVGWYDNGGSAASNVTPHYFRHFFTTHLRDRTGDRGIVKYLRGDVADDIIDTYTHNWGNRVRRRYESSIYRLFD